MRLKLAFAIVILLTLVGCRSNKSTQSAGEPVSSNATLSARYTMLTESWKPWNDMEAGMKVSLTSPSRLNAAGKVWMKRGQWISMSVRMLGFEVATLWVDSDSIVAVDKFHKKYLCQSTSSVLGSAGVTIADIQDMLLGRAFITGHGTATPADRQEFDFESATNGWYMLPRRQPEKFTYGFLGSSTSNALRGATVEVSGFGSFTARYDDLYESRNAGWFAQEVSVETTRGVKLGATIKWDLNSAKFNAGVNRSRNIPDNCERIEASTLTSLLKNF